MIEGIEKFLATRGFLPVTVEGYRSLLWDFDQFLADRSISFDQITSADIVADWFASRPQWGDCQQAKALNAIRSYARWKSGCEHPILDYKIRRPPMKPQRTLTEDQVHDLLETINLDDKTGIRDYAIVSLMIDTGLRASEVCRLRLDHVDLDKFILQVQIKGGSWGSGVFSEQTRNCLEDWLTIRQHIAQPGCLSFFCSVGGSYPGTELTRDGLGAIFKALSNRAGFRVSPHDLRRTMATLLVLHGAPTELVRKQGRWKTFEQVIRYTQAVPVDAIREYLPMR